jgi:chromosome segregation ATPase
LITEYCYYRSELEKQDESYKKQLEELAQQHTDELARIKKQHHEAIDRVNRQLDDEKVKLQVIEDDKRCLNLEVAALQVKVNELQEEIKNSDIERERAEFKTKLTTVKQKYA